jgi:hypothetical protein
MLGRNKGPTPSQMRAMQQDQMAMQRQQKIANQQVEAAAAKTQAAEKEYRNMQLREGVAPDKVKPLSAKNAPPAPRPMEQVEIDKAKQLAAIPQPYMPQANTVPNPQMAAMQKMPQPGTVPPANAIPMAPSNPGGPSSGLGSGGPGAIPMAPSNPGGPSSGLGRTAQLGSQNIPLMKRGGKVRNKPAAKFSSGGSTSKASSRGDGIAQRGKTKGRYI